MKTVILRIIIKKIVKISNKINNLQNRIKKNYRINQSHKKEFQSLPILPPRFEFNSSLSLFAFS